MPPAMHQQLSVVDRASKQMSWFMVSKFPFLSPPAPPVAVASAAGLSMGTLWNSGLMCDSAVQNGRAKSHGIDL